LGVAGSRIFYELGSRKNDFSGYLPNESPLIVLDDVFGNSPSAPKRVKELIRKHTLLKILAGEAILVDRKYNTTVELKTVFRVILTNDRKLFQVDAYDRNLQIRTKIIIWKQATIPDVSPIADTEVNNGQGDISTKW